MLAAAVPETVLTFLKRTQFAHSSLCILRAFHQARLLLLLLLPGQARPGQPAKLRDHHNYIVDHYWQDVADTYEFNWPPRWLCGPTFVIVWWPEQTKWNKIASQSWLNTSDASFEWTASAQWLLLHDWKCQSRIINVFAVLKGRKIKLCACSWQILCVPMIFCCLKTTAQILFFQHRSKRRKLPSHCRVTRRILSFAYCQLFFCSTVLYVCWRPSQASD